MGRQEDYESVVTAKYESAPKIDAMLRKRLFPGSFVEITDLNVEQDIAIRKLKYQVIGEVVQNYPRYILIKVHGKAGDYFTTILKNDLVSHSIMIKPYTGDN